VTGEVSTKARTDMKKQVGSLALAAAAFIVGAATVELLPHVYGQESAVKKPMWHYGLSLRVRQAAEADFTKDTKKVGLEVYKDENNGNLIYVSETGSIAVLPGK
jgi:hypothetical protein